MGRLNKGGPKPSIQNGDIYYHKTYGEYCVVDYKDAHNVTICFKLSGYTYTVGASQIKNNEVKDKTQERVYGVGINDADYLVIIKNGRGRGCLNKSKCPFWTKWVSMLDRCYSGNYPTYKGVKVCDEWLTFSSFKAWMETQDWEGKHLDKDLIGDSTLYSPETCIFVTAQVNGFITKCEKGFSKKGKKFLARCSNPFSKNKEVGRHLGMFETEVEARLAWKIKKHEYSCMLADLQDDPCVADALRQRYAPDNFGCK